MNINEMRSNAEQVAELLKVMAHPQRLLVLCQLVNAEVGAGELQKHSNLSQSAFSQHLTVLRRHGLIKSRKEAQQVFYSLADPRASALIHKLYDIFCNQSNEEGKS